MTSRDEQFAPTPHDPPHTITAPVSPTGGSAEPTVVQHDVPSHLFGGAPAVPGYVISREIARGGMGVVYAARDPAFDRDVAIKVMHPGLDTGRFVVESRITAQLPHPGVPPVHALGTLPDGRPFLAMKLVAGHTLADELRAADRRAALPNLLDQFQRICQTVGFAHSRGIAHRDLKPSNVMVGSFGEVLVMDWGLAKQVTGGPQAVGSDGPDTDPLVVNPTRTGVAPEETAAGAVKGTPAYMAPEQARGEPVDARADVFALGGILAAILTGNPPFIGGTVLETVLMAARGELAGCLAQLDACGADAELVAMTKRCLAPNPADRYPDGEAVAAAVGAYRAGVEQRLRAAERERAAAEVRAVEHKRQKRAQMIGIAIMAVVMTLVNGLIQRYERREEQQTAERALKDEREAADRREIEARLDAERGFKVEQARLGVRSALALSADLRRQSKFGPAGAALSQAVELAKGAPELAPVVEQARRDLALVARLDDIRFRKWAFVSRPAGRSGYSLAIAPPEYRNAFAAYGLDLAALEPADAAARIAASDVKADLVAAVDDWATYEPDDTRATRLLDVARRADPGAWTDRLRNPAVRADRAKVAALAAETDPAAAPAAALSVLAALMRHYELDPAKLLEAARAKHPTSFELALALSRATVGDQTGRQLAALDAARALRPESAIVWNNLGVGLLARGDREGANRAWREAVRLDPALACAHSNLGGILPLVGALGEGVSHCREAVRLDPTNAEYLDNLGLALHRTGELDRAAVAFKAAIRLDPKLAAAVNNLGAVYLDQDRTADGIACARAAIRIDPTYSNAHAMLGDVLRRTGDLTGARAALTEAVRLDKRWAPLLAKLPPDSGTPKQP